jgi:tRNA(Ile)-lysidine synthase
VTAAALADLVRATLRRHAMLAGGERVLIGVSGGADSVALLTALVTLAPELRLDLHVLHVDHQLRRDSARDGVFVEELGHRLGVPVTVKRVDVRRGGSIEEAARIARHAALEAVATRVGAARIALGHTADDQAETVLMRVLQGASVRGLAAIPPVRGRIIRPLIHARRRDVEAALRGAGCAWLEDPTNRDPKFLRNRVRHELLPLLASGYDGDVVPALVRTASLAREATEALDDLAARDLERLGHLEPDGAWTFSITALRALPAFVAPEILRQAAARLGGTAPLRAWAHRGLVRVTAAPPPRRAFRLGGVTISVSGDRVRLGRSLPETLQTQTLTVPGRVELREAGRVLEATVVDATAYTVPVTANAAGFDADLLPPALLVRARRDGDRFTPFGHDERRLKSFLIGAKVPRWERDRLPIVEADGDIVWVAGVRRGATAPITARTRRVLHLALLPFAAQ